MPKFDTGSLIFLDIETVPGEASFMMLSEDWQELWTKKSARTLPPDVAIEDFYQQQAAISAEFAKIVCISFGYYRSSGSERKLRIKSLFGNDEKELLSDFIDMLAGFEKHHKAWIFAGHNVKEFDLPFLSRRMLINGLRIPASMNFQNMKPWEINVVDTMHYWRFGDYRNYTSLELLATALGIPSPKSDINGSQVGEVFWKEKNLKRIAEYCQRDVATVANIIQRFNGDAILREDEIEIAE